MRHDGPGVLLTGGTGFLGGEVLARLLERDEQPVYALVRAGSDEEAQARLRRVVESLLGGAEGWSRRAIAVAGDITSDGLGMSGSRRNWLAERVERIVHCAASVSFTLDLAESRAINVEGTRRVIELGELCTRRCRAGAGAKRLRTGRSASHPPGSQALNSSLSEPCYHSGREA